MFKLSDSFTVGVSLALIGLQTSEKASSDPSETSPRKSFVKFVPQPKETLTRSLNFWCKSLIVGVSKPSEKITNLSSGFSPLSFHQAIAASAPSTGSPQSIRIPVHCYSQSRALFKKAPVPYVSGKIIRKFPSCSSCQSAST